MAVRRFCDWCETPLSTANDGSRMFEIRHPHLGTLVVTRPGATDDVCTSCVEAAIASRPNMGRADPDVVPIREAR